MNKKPRIFLLYLNVAFRLYCAAMSEIAEIKCNFLPEELEALILDHACHYAVQKIHEARFAQRAAYFGKPLPASELAAKDPRLRYFHYDQAGRRRLP